VTFFLDGLFTISDGVDTIMSVAFENAELHFQATASGSDFKLARAGASFIGNNALPGQIVTYTAGTNAAFLAMLGGMDVGGSQEFSFTVENLDGGMMINGDPLGVEDDFEFSSSFSGQSELIPEPAALGMIGLGLLVIARRRAA
jgi:hypothetical protein